MLANEILYDLFQNLRVEPPFDLTEPGDRSRVFDKDTAAELLVRFNAFVHFHFEAA